MNMLEWIGAILLGIGVVAILVLLFAFPVKWLWNWVMVGLGLPAITYWKSAGLILLLNILFGGRTQAVENYKRRLS